MKNSAKISKLETLLTEAQDAYYAGVPIISDAEYDALADELRMLDPDNAALKKVGAAVPQDSPLVKLPHRIPMGSQSKVNSLDEFVKWAKGTKADRFALQEKLDGLSVELVYRAGKLIQAITRGSGTEGESVLHTVSQMRNVKGVLPNRFDGSLRGEIIFERDRFKKAFGDDPKKHGYSNPRNAAAGLTRRKDVHAAVPEITVLYFDCDTPDKIFTHETNKINYIRDELKLKTVETRCVSVDNAIKWFAHYQQGYKDHIDCEIDGLVIKVNELKVQKALGEIADRPRGQIAWKFEAEQRRSVLKNVRWDVGLTGRITPVAEFVAVTLGGVEITNASLHNVANMQALGAYLGAKILVSRRNDVIPYLEEVLNPIVGKTIPVPTACPVCAGKVAFEGEFLVCANDICPAKAQGDISKWIKVLEIDNLGSSFVETMHEKGLVTDPADLYVLSEATLSVLDGYGDVSAKRIVRNIAKSSEVPLTRFLAGLNIPNVSIATFEAIEKAGFDTLESVRNATVDDLLKAEGIGQITAEAVHKGLRKKSAVIDKLLNVGVTIKKKVKGKLSGKSFCFTGEISLKRGVASKFVESLGGEVRTSVSKGLDYLVQANPNSNSTKSQKAREYGTKVIGEKEFLQLVDFSAKRLRDLANQ